MPKRRKKKTGPRYKRLNRKGRLQAAVAWLPKYNGKNIIKGYSKHFGVSKLCAALELQMLGCEITTDVIEKLKTDEARLVKLKEQRKRELLEERSDSDETFAFIAGYTPNGFPYGIRWDELEEFENQLDD